MGMVLNGARALGQIRRRHKMASVDAHDPDQPSFVVQRHARLWGTVANIMLQRQPPSSRSVNQFVATLVGTTT